MTPFDLKLECVHTRLLKLVWVLLNYRTVIIYVVGELVGSSHEIRETPSHTNPVPGQEYTKTAK